MTLPMTPLAFHNLIPPPPLFPMFPYFIVIAFISLHVDYISDRPFLLLTAYRHTVGTRFVWLLAPLSTLLIQQSPVLSLFGI